MKTKKIVALLLILAVCFSLTACTTAGENVNEYFNQVSKKLAIINGNKSSSSDSSDSKTPLAAPANLTIDENGNFSFESVENADNYIVYFYDKSTDVGRYNSNPITETSGNLRDLVDYAFGIYNIKVVAYPDATDKTYKKSDAATAEYTYQGEVVAPEYAYRWDCFTKEFGVELVNIAEYEKSTFPLSAEITLTPASGDAVTLSIEGFSLEDNIFSAGTESLANGDYTITAVTTWDSEIVTNSVIESDIGNVTISDKYNAMSAGYGYLNTDVYTTLDYPTVADFDPTVGGSIGTWYYFENYKVSYKGVVTTATFGERDVEDVWYTATPAETVTDGSLYSFDIELQNASGKISLYDGFFYHDQNKGYGTLEVKEDGTFTLEILGSVQEESSSQQGGMGMGGSGGVPHGSIQGTWIDNGDGTIKLSYDRTTAVSDSTGAH